MKLYTRKYVFHRYKFVIFYLTFYNAIRVTFSCLSLEVLSTAGYARI